MVELYRVVVFRKCKSTSRVTFEVGVRTHAHAKVSNCSVPSEPPSQKWLAACSVKLRLIVAESTCASARETGLGSRRGLKGLKEARKDGEAATVLSPGRETRKVVFFFGAI